MPCCLVLLQDDEDYTRSGESWGLLLCDTNMQLRHRKQLSGLMEELLMVAK
ncbi:hypothetical protein ABKV19_008672 [Rosa sericea]